MSSRSARRRVLAVCGTAAVVAILGCGDDKPDAPAPTITSPSTTAPSTLDPESEDEAALRQLAEDWFEAVRRIFIDGEDPALAEQYIAGDYLDQFRQHVLDNEAAGYITERDPEGRSRTEIETISVEAGQGDITECLVDADILIDGKTGIIVNDGITARRLMTEATLTTSGWRLSKRLTISTHKNNETCYPS